MKKLLFILCFSCFLVGCANSGEESGAPSQEAQSWLLFVDAEGAYYGNENRLRLSQLSAARYFTDRPYHISEPVSSLRDIQNFIEPMLAAGIPPNASISLVSEAGEIHFVAEILGVIPEGADALELIIGPLRDERSIALPQESFDRVFFSAVIDDSLIVDLFETAESTEDVELVSDAEEYGKKHHTSPLPTMIYQKSQLIAYAKAEDAAEAFTAKMRELKQAKREAKALVESGASEEEAIAQTGLSQVEAEVALQRQHLLTQFDEDELDAAIQDASQELVESGELVAEDVTESLLLTTGEIFGTLVSAAFVVGDVIALAEFGEWILSDDTDQKINTEIASLEAAGNTTCQSYAGSMALRYSLLGNADSLDQKLFFSLKGNEYFCNASTSGNRQIQFLSSQLLPSQDTLSVFCDSNKLKSQLERIYGGYFYCDQNNALAVNEQVGFTSIPNFLDLIDGHLGGIQSGFISEVNNPDLAKSAKQQCNVFVSHASIYHNAFDDDQSPLFQQSYVTTDPDTEKRYYCQAVAADTGVGYWMREAQEHQDYVTQTCAQNPEYDFSKVFHGVAKCDGKGGFIVDESRLLTTIPAAF